MIAGSAASSPRVLYVGSEASPQSGAYRSMLGMALNNPGSILVLPLSTDDTDREVSPASIPTYHLKLPRPHRGMGVLGSIRYAWHFLLSVFRLAAVIDRERIEIVHINEILDLYAGLAARLRGVVCVWHIRADLSSCPLLQWVLPRIVNVLADVVIVVSDCVRAALFEGQGLSTRKVRVIHDPRPPVEAFCPFPDGTKIRDEFHLEGDAKLVVLVAKLAEPKGHRQFIKAASETLRVFPGAHFLIVGGELPGAHHARYAAELRELLQSLSIGHRVRLTGFRSDDLALMAAADVVVHCSIYPDPYPGVVIKAMMLGRAIVASSLGGAKEQISDGVTGVLADPRDTHALSAAICRLLADDALRARLGAAAHDSIMHHMDEPEYQQALRSVYVEILERRRMARRGTATS